MQQIRVMATTGGVRQRARMEVRSEVATMQRRRHRLGLQVASAQARSPNGSLAAIGASRPPASVGPLLDAQRIGPGGLSN